MAESLEKYELYDVISGAVYAVFVPAAEVAALDLCKSKPCIVSGITSR